MLAFVLALAGLEAGARVYWWIRHERSVLHPGQVLEALYPELKRVELLQPRRGDGWFNVLVLDGSVFHPDWGEVESSFTQQLAAKGLRNARIFNLGEPAHTSRDSLLKYAALEDARFDLVVYYNGINDARANNVPPDLFRSDYSHFSWYAAVNSVAPYHHNAWLALPYTVRYGEVVTTARLHPARFVPMNEPRDEWTRYGGSLRGLPAFEQNLRGVVAIAADRHDPLMVMTFAFHVPDNYSREAFLQKRLDYGRHRLPIEIWGRREHVVAAMVAQNDVVRRVAAEYHLPLVDEARLMHRSARTFDDPCHLTAEGSAEFVRHMVDAIRPTT